MDFHKSIHDQIGSKTVSLNESFPRNAYHEQVSNNVVNFLRKANLPILENIFSNKLKHVYNVIINQQSIPAVYKQSFLDSRQNSVTCSVLDFYNYINNINNLHFATAMHPLELLSSDDWNQICGHLPVAMDRWNAANAHPVFLEILKSDKKQWSSILMGVVYFHVSHYLTKNDILKLRMINKATKYTIDGLLKEKQICCFRNHSICVHLVNPDNPALNEDLSVEAYSDNSDDSSSTCSYESDHCTEFHYVEEFYVDKDDIQRANVHYIHMSNSDNLDTSIKFLRSSSILQSMNLMVSASLHPESHVFFSEFESQIVCIKLTQYVKNANKSDMYALLESLRNILVCVPSLKKLSLELSNENKPRSRNNQSQNSFAKFVHRYFQEKTLPVLHQLESLKLATNKHFRYYCNEGFANYTYHLFSNLLKIYNTQLCSLDLSCYAVDRPKSIMPTNMICLKNLKLQIQNRAEFLRFQAFSAPIEQLEILIVSSRSSRELFEILKKFKDTLVDLSVYSHNWEVGWIDELPASVDLPNLKHLKFDGTWVGKTEKNFPFLENLSNLQTFKIKLCEVYHGEGDFESTSSSSELEYTPLISNTELPNSKTVYTNRIWKKVPFLETVQVVLEDNFCNNLECRGLRQRTFCRSEYEKFQKAMRQE